MNNPSAPGPLALTEKLDWHDLMFGGDAAKLRAFGLIQAQIAELIAQNAGLATRLDALLAAHNRLALSHGQDLGQLPTALAARESRVDKSSASETDWYTPSAGTAADSWLGPEGWVSQYTAAESYLYTPGYPAYDSLPEDPEATYENGA